MYKWIEPKICSESVEEAVQLPASGEMVACTSCNPGFFFSNTSTCEPCPHGFYSNGTGRETQPTGQRKTNIKLTCDRICISVVSLD